jgi:methylase of polypeptide subunit release factors
MEGLAPYLDSFPPALQDYCEHMRAAIAQNKHHDQRRHLFISFLRKGLGIEAEEIELEHKTKANEVRGRIDALFRFLIIEFKSDLDRERDDAHRELKKYFESRPHPGDYVGLITDGMRFEVCIYTSDGIKQISAFEFEADAPLHAFRHLDQILFTGKRLIPSSGDIVVRFGSNSAVFNAGLRALRQMFESVKANNLVKTKFSEWNALLAKVYGTALGDAALFLKHTYLTMVSRAIVAMALFPTNVRTLRQYRGIVDGEFFKNQNLKNLAEPDFFSWALDTGAEKQFVEFVERLFRCLEVYDFEKLGEDILKELYQGLVDPADRHDLGEYYTPDWLAELTLEAIQYRKGKLLDPACGSGTFLFTAVDRLRRHGLSGGKLVAYTLESILGIDVHPVAVLMAKANILLSLRKEIKEFASDISLRVYMADSLLTEEDTKEGVLKVPVSLATKEIFHIPLASVDRVDLDALIDRLSILAKRGAGSDRAKAKATESAGKLFAPFTHKEKVYWKANFRLMLKLEAQSRNSIWAYILKNAYRPVFLRREKVDYLVGNPPWLSYRYIKDESYQRRVKDLTFAYGLLKPTERKLITQMDTSTLFFVHCSREFLKPNGTIAFVLPKSVLVPAKQHAAFQQLGFSQVHDFTAVEPLFNVRTCVLARDPTHRLTEIPRVQWSGQLPFKNCNLETARSVLTSETDRFDFIIASEPLSPYFERVFQGASLVPRCLSFVEPPKESALNLETPFLRTSADAWEDSKKEWKLKVEGKIEKEFLFGTVLAKDLVPFAVRKLSLTVLPIREDSHHDIKMVTALDALGEGFTYAHDWFLEAERIWNKRRKDKNLSWHGRLNYTHLLTDQKLHAKFIVLYNKSGTNISAAMLAPRETKKISELSTRGFVADHVTYRYYASTEEEAHYLVGILNSTVVNEAIKPYQSQGLLGERDIHRRPFENCPIPPFDAKDSLHLKIAEIARDCREHLLPIVRKMKSPVATARADARKLVRGKLNQLDTLVSKLLGDTRLSTRVVKKKTEAQGELIY